MIKFLFLGRRAPGLTRQAAQAHLRNIHGRMVVMPPADAGAMPAYYVQNHVTDGGYPAGDGPHALERDLVTELHFESMVAMQAAVETRYYRETLRADEPRFVHDPSVVRLNVAPRTIAAGPRTGAKLFVFASRMPGLEQNRWNAVRDRVANTMAAWDGIVALTENVVAMRPNGERFVDSVFEAWLQDHAGAIAAAANVPLLLDADGIDRARSLTIVAEEFTQERLRSLLAEPARMEANS